MLEALVPQYFAAVTLDSFDGEPIRYSPGRKVKYAVSGELLATILELATVQ